jgi:hypothetical protein
VFNLKWSGIFGAFAFVLSLLIGLLSGAGLIALIRALILGLAFALLGSLIYWLVHHFLSELLDPEASDDEEGPGARVNITVEGDDGFDESELLSGGIAAEDAGPEGLGDRENGPGSEGDNSPEDRTALDQKREDGYTKEGEVMETGTPAAADDSGENPVSGASSGAAIPGDSDSVDALPDLDNFSSAFLPSGEESGGEVPAAPPSLPDSPRDTGKNRAAAGDFNPKEMASAIQTALKRD